MTLSPTSDPVWVDQPDAFQRMISDLKRHPLLAVDTESNSLYAFQERVCLIQFSTGECDYLVDSISLVDLSALQPIFADPVIEKVFHAAEYDLICLKRDYSFSFENIFDTMIAARILGRSEVGLAAVLQAEFEVQLDKRYQRADWGKRPLPSAQMDYARLDTFYLLSLRSRLADVLQEAGRWDLAQEDFRRLCSVAVPVNGTASIWRISGSQDLTPQQAAVLQELCNYRETRARQADLPVFKIISNETLLNIAIECPETTAALDTMNVLSPRQLHRHRDGLVAAVRRGLNSRPLERPQYHPRPDDAFLARIEALRTWRKETGVEIGVPSDVILPRDVMEQIASANPATLEALASVMDGLPWRLNRFGKEILSVIHP